MLKYIIKFLTIVASWDTRMTISFLFSGKAAPLDCYYTEQEGWKLLLPNFGYGIALDALVYKIKKVKKCQIVSRNAALDSYEYTINIDNKKYTFYTDHWNICTVSSHEDNNNITELRDILLSTNSLFLRHDTPPRAYM